MGEVQGVGFRPWVFVTATRLGLTGWVRNQADGVCIEAQGERVGVLLEGLAEAPAPIRAVVAERTELALVEEQGFRIVPSEGQGIRIPTLPPDLATCPACLGELDDPTDRRHGYLLLSCVRCGPRYSIAGAPPFDRERTAMRAFPLCEACQREHDDPTDRRYHAQASACARCGPRLSLSLEQANEVLRAGRILAVKGLAGFQLLVDARNPRAVRELRRRKRRPHKPFAVLVAEPPGSLDPNEVRALLGPDAPIVLCEADLALTPEVTGPCRSVGLMLPSTAVHRALARSAGGPLVCTSANVSGEPLAIEAAAVGALADGVLDHDRPIWRGADDSVVRVVVGRTRVFRRARGHAPRPIRIGRDGPSLLALGADLKAVVGLALGEQAALSPHLGSLGSRPMLERLEREIASLCEVYGVQPEGVVVDAHPDLVSTQAGERLAAAWDVPVQRVQHHHAHVAAVCAEHGLEGPVLGLALDGVGLGADGGVWGGEVLAVDGAACERRAHLHRFALPGGDACAREPGRAALALLHAAGLEADPTLHPQAEVLWGWLASLAPTCSAAGRLFDGVAVLAGLDPRVSFEAQLPIQLEQAAAEVGALAPYELAEEPLDWRPWVRGVVTDRRAGASVACIAARFHAALVEGLARAVGDAERVVLAGGCFQNRVLVEGLVERLGPRVWLPERVPPGDGAVALGQLWVARRRRG